MTSFFDRFPRFFDTSRAGSSDRLRWRYNYLFHERRDLFQGKRVLDLGSHDGRWSFCALHAGARYVLGVEARAELVRSGVANIEHYGISRASFDFLIGDVFEVLPAIDPRGGRGLFDVGLVLGFLYHTARHFETLALVERLGCQNVIVETNVIPNETRPLVLFRMEEVDVSHNAYSRMGVTAGRTMSGLPSIPAVEMLLHCFGYRSEVLPLPTMDDVEGIEDFQTGRRVAILGVK